MVYPRLKEAMKDHGWTTADVMKVLRLDSPDAIRNRMNGRTDFKPLEKEKLSDVLEIGEEELFRR